MSDIHGDILAKRALQIQRGAARAAVLGVNDGLVSILCLVLAVAAAGASGANVLLAGFAGVIAGAISMSAGEWISVKAQVELFGGVIQDIRRLMRTHRPMMQEQIANGLIATGQNKTTAHEAAREIASNDTRLLQVYARQIMGFNPNELGSPWIAALSSFLLFTLGALAPMAPWFFVEGTTAIALSVCFTAIGSLVVGGYVAASSGKSIMYGAVRQLAIIALASVVTYGVGYLFGITTS